MNVATLAARNLLRNRTRVALTIAGVAVAVLTFVLLRTVLWAWTVSIDTGADDRIATRDRISFTTPLPRHYVDKIRALPEVRAATWMSWFGGKDPRDASSFFASMAVDQESFLDVFREVVVSPEARARWRAEPRAALVGDALARRMGLHEGDRVTLEGTLYPGDWEFIVAGIYTITAESFDRSMFLFRWDRLNAVAPADRRDKVGWILSRVDDTRRAAAVSQAIDGAFDVRDQQTLTMSERALNRSFIAMFDAVLAALEVVSTVILGIMALILGNTMAMGVRERVHEHGVLRALGFQHHHLVVLVVGEGALIGLLGGLAGVGLGALVVAALSRWVEEGPLSSVFPFFRVQPATLATALGLAVAVGALASVIPAVLASRRKVVEALRLVG